MLSKWEEDNLKRPLDEHGVSVAFRHPYYAFAWEIKGKKIQTKEDIEKVIKKRKQEGLNEEIMRFVAKNFRPELH